MGGVILLLVAFVLILALRSPEVHLSPWHQGLWTRITGLVCVALFLVLSAGVVVFHAANAAPTVVPAGSRPWAATASPHGAPSPQPAVMALPTPFPSPTPSPTPFPRLVPGPSQALTTFCHAIDHHDLNRPVSAFLTLSRR